MFHGTIDTVFKNWGCHIVRKGKEFFRTIAHRDTKSCIVKHRNIIFAVSDSDGEAVISNLPAIDAKIEEKAEGWTVSRMAKADLTVMRLAVFEILFDESVPNGVAINEAVNLAKTYGTEKASGFINGVLASIVRELPEKE